MKWAKIAKYAAVLFGVRFALGFFEGLFLTPDGTGEALSIFVGRSAACLAASGTVFAHLSVHQSFRPFAHAWLVLLAQATADAVLMLALPSWLVSPPILVTLEWLMLVCALVAGTAAGSNLRRKRVEPANA